MGRWVEEDDMADENGKRKKKLGVSERVACCACVCVCASVARLG